MQRTSLEELEAPPCVPPCVPLMMSGGGDKGIGIRKTRQLNCSGKLMPEAASGIVAGLLQRQQVRRSSYMQVRRDVDRKWFPTSSGIDCRSKSQARQSMSYCEVLLQVTKLRDDPKI